MIFGCSKDYYDIPKIKSENFRYTIRFIDPDGRLEDWYEKYETGNIVWHGGNSERSGQANITKKANGDPISISGVVVITF